MEGRRNSVGSGSTAPLIRLIWPGMMEVKLPEKSRWQEARRAALGSSLYLFSSCEWLCWSATIPRVIKVANWPATPPFPLDRSNFALLRWNSFLWEPVGSESGHLRWGELRTWEGRRRGRLDLIKGENRQWPIITQKCRWVRLIWISIQIHYRALQNILYIDWWYKYRVRVIVLEHISGLLII